MLQIEDLLPFYQKVAPNQTQTYLSSLYEFTVLKSSPGRELLPPRGKWFRHQLFDYRYMRFHNECFLLDEMGTGKSGVVISVAENLMRDVNTPYHHTYILVKGKTLAAEWLRQIVCLSPAGRYDELNPEVARAKTEKHRNTLIKTEVKRFYSIWTYNHFAAVVRQAQTDADLQRMFAGTIIYVDESHNLKLSPEADRLPSDEREPANREKTGTFSKLEQYGAIKKVFHTVRPLKKILGSGSAMVNEPVDIAEQMNLLLPSTNQVPTDPEYWDQIDINHLANIAGDLFTYIRSEDIGLKLQYNGIKLPIRDMSNIGINNPIQTHRPVQVLPMSSWQSNQYKLLAKARSAFTTRRSNERQASNIVYPNFSEPNEIGLLGENGYRQLVRTDMARKTIDYKSKLNNDGSTLLGQAINLRIASVKIAYIINQIGQDIAAGRKRKYYIYSDFLFNGVYPMAKALEQALGFARMETNRSIFGSTFADSNDELNPYCTTRNRQVQIPNIPVANRYVVVENSSPYRIISEAWNAPANATGDYVRAIILSPAGREGLNLTETTRVFLMQGEWNPANERQALFRILRAGGFEITRRNLAPDELIVVEIDRMAAVTLTDDEQAQLAQYTDRNSRLQFLSQVGRSVDIDNYYRVAYREQRIARVMRIFKQIAITCPFFYTRNVRLNDVDHSPDCDFDICKYQCWGKTVDYQNYNNYDNLYAHQELDQIITKLKDIFNFYFSRTWSQIQTALSEHRVELILRAVLQSIEQRTIYYDRFGYRAYLQEQGDIIYLISDYPLSFHHPYGLSASYYVLHQVRIRNQNLGELWEAGAHGQQFMNEDINYFNQARNRTDVANIINGMDTYHRARLIETYAINKYLNQQPESQIITWLLEFLGKQLIELTYPTRAIEKEVLEFRPLIAGENSTDKIWVHTIYRRLTGRSRHGRTAQERKAEGRIRIFRPLEGLHWRDVTDYEAKVIRPLIEQELTSETESNQPYWGYVDEQGKFLLRDKLTENKELAAKNRKYSHKFRVCTTFQVYQLLTALDYLNVAPPPVDFQNRVFSAQNMSDILQQILIGRPDGDLPPRVQQNMAFYFQWMIAYKNGQIVRGMRKTISGGKQLLCGAIKNALEAKGWFGRV